jgi:regulatory protein
MLYFEVIIMKVTSLTKQKKNENRYNVYIDNEFAFSASLENIVKYSIKQGMELTEDELQNLSELCEGAKAYEYALFILSRRDYTTLEVERKLMHKEYSEATISRVLEKLKLYGIISDDRFIEKYVNDGQKIKKHGIRKIKHDLGSKGIGKESIQAIQKDENLEFNNAYSLAKKKLELIKDKDKQKEKIYRNLVSKGYEYDIIKRVLNTIFNDGGSEFE